jgi:hypothetical protein
MNFHRQCASFGMLAALLVPAASAQHASIDIPNIGHVSLAFVPEPHSAGDYQSVTIIAAGKAVRFTPKDPISTLPTNSTEQSSIGLPVRVSGLKPNPSHLFLQGQYNSDQPHTLLFFLSSPQASDAPALLVIGFTYLGEPYKVLEQRHFDITAFTSTENGSAHIIGKAAISQVIGGDGGNGSKSPYATTYDPFSVYIAHAEGTADYSLEATRTYNESHYVWAGPKSREDYAVFYNVPGHSRPFGAPASKVDELITPVRK